MSNVPKEKGGQCSVVEGSVAARNGQHRGNFGTEDEPAGRHGIQERLLADSVARAEKNAFFAIEEGECEHPAEVPKDIGPVQAVGFEQDLGVRCSSESTAVRLQRAAELSAVVDLAVVGNGEPPVGAQHRLVAGGREVQDGEAGVTEPDSDLQVQPRPLLVGTAMLQPLVHAVKRAGKIRSFDGGARAQPHSAYPAHDPCGGWALRRTAALLQQKQYENLSLAVGERLERLANQRARPVHLHIADLDGL